MRVQVSPAITINAAHIFEDPAFVEWLNSQETLFTWHKGGRPTDWSDTVILVDPSLNGEGSESDMPEHIWEEILAACRQHFQPNYDVPHIMVRLTNETE